MTARAGPALHFSRHLAAAAGQAEACRHRGARGIPRDALVTLHPPAGGPVSSVFRLGGAQQR
jgi:hypothetical protein